MYQVLTKKNYKINNNLALFLYKRSFRNNSVLTSTNLSEDFDLNNSTEIDLNKVSNLNDYENFTKNYEKIYSLSKLNLKKDISNKNTLSNIQQTLKPYLYACVNSNLENQGLKSLDFYIKRFNFFKKTEPEVSINLLNVLAKKFSLDKNLTSLDYCLDLILKNNLKPDSNFFAYFLYAICEEKHYGEIKLIMNLVSKYNLLNENLLINSYLTHDQKNLIINTLQNNGFNYNFKTKIKKSEYETELVKKYYEENRKNFSLIENFKFDENLFNEQLQNEENIFVKISSAFNFKVSKYNQDAINDLLNDWNKCLTEAFNRNLEIVKNQNSSLFVANNLPFLMCLNEKNTIDSIIRFLFESSKTKFLLNNHFLAFKIGDILENRYFNSLKLKKSNDLKNLYKNYFNHISNKNEFSKFNSRQFIENNYDDYILFNKELKEMLWSYKNKKDLGAHFLNICLEELKINRNHFKSKKVKKESFAFVKTLQVNNNVQNECVSPSSVLNKLSSEAKTNLYIPAENIPMFVPPLPWINSDGFPFLITNLFFVLEPLSFARAKIRNNLEKSNINAVYDAINYTSLIPWTINKPVLDILLEIFRQGGDKDLDIPHHKLKMPPIPTKDQFTSFFAYKQNSVLIKKTNQEMYSLWCELNLRLSIANELKDKTFWLPSLIDFRGRVYPSSIYLSPVSNDVSRSLLLFGSGKKLGKNGLDWLKIHLVNLTGLKKSGTNKERLEYANELLPEIIDSAENPLNGKGWWKNCEDPWQVLACCFEINKVLKFGKDHENYVCHFPVHQDGSCNGLQHYAALGRDEKGAKSVNLDPSEKPSDIYTEVSRLVENKRQKDAIEGLEKAICLENFINRKLVKATVMTNVYGVTLYGAKLQFKKVLKQHPDFPEEKFNICLEYLAQTVFEAIKDLFTCSKEIQDWLISVSNAVGKRLNLPMQWKTPLGLTVEQFYYKNKKDFQSSLKVNVAKQKNACPPNFIHSLDATHMMLTSLYCEKKGINFASVHDSFWTHPSDINEMSIILREQFVNLYTNDLLKILSDDLVKVYKPHLIKNSLTIEKEDLIIINLLKDIPNRGNFKIERVLKSEYFFS